MAAAGKPRASLLPMAANWLHVMWGFVGAAHFPLFAGTNVSKCILQRLGSLLFGQVKALLNALLGVWKNVAFVKN